METPGALKVGDIRPANDDRFPTRKGGLPATTNANPASNPLVKSRRLRFTLLLLLLGGSLCVAQIFRGGGRGRRSLDRADYPTWQISEQVPHDVFTFVRVRYSSYSGSFRARWDGDYPDSDLNFSYRLQELTSLEVNPDVRVVELSDAEIFEYPFLYLISPGAMALSDEEARNLRKYLLNGGFLMVDDFWGREHWEHLYLEMKRVFPDREPVELPLTHPIFHMVFDLDRKPQVPSIQAWSRGYSVEPWHGDMSDPEPHFQGFLDDDGRLVALLCHNNDLGDGWEREGENHEYFKQYSERWSYPMGINIVMYAMTH